MDGDGDAENHEGTGVVEINYDPSRNSLEAVRVRVPPGVVTADGIVERPMIGVRELPCAYTPLFPFLDHIRHSLDESSMRPKKFAFTLPERADAHVIGSIEFDFRIPPLMTIPESTLKAPDTSNRDVVTVLTGIKKGAVTSEDGLAVNLDHYDIPLNSPEGQFLVDSYREHVVQPILEGIVAGEIISVDDPKITALLGQGYFNEGVRDRIARLMTETEERNRQREAQLRKIRGSITQLLTPNEGEKHQVFPGTYKDVRHRELLPDKFLDQALDEMSEEELLVISRKMFWEALGYYEKETPYAPTRYEPTNFEWYLGVSSDDKEANYLNIERNFFISETSKGKIRFRLQGLEREEIEEAGKVDNDVNALLTSMKWKKSPTGWRDMVDGSIDVDVEEAYIIIQQLRAHES